MLEVHAATIRLFIHVFAATIWVGGQFTLAGLVPVVRKLGPEATKSVARAFDRIAWPAFVVLIASGVWNLVDVDVTEASTEYQVTVMVKLLFVALTGSGAAVHRVTGSKKVLAIGGGAAAIGALGALFLGVQLRT